MKTTFASLLVLLSSVWLAAQEIPLRQAYDLRWNGFHQRAADNCELVFWTDTSAGHRDIFAQKIGPNGQALWNEAQAVVNHGGDQQLLDVVPSSDNNFILVWGEVEIDDIPQIRTQKISSNGQRLWAGAGVAVGGVDHLKTAKLVPNLAGGAFVLFQNWSEQTIRGQNLDGWGNQLWPNGGIALVSHSSILDLDSAVADGEGGFIADVSKNTNSVWISELTRYSAQGTVVGSDPLIPVGSMPNFTRYSILQSTPGSFILYHFGFSPNCGLWQRRIDNLGVPASPYTTVASLQLNNDLLLPPMLVPTEDGGTIAGYESTAESGGKLLVARFTADFDLVWPGAGVEIATGGIGSWRDLRFAPTAAGGVWLTWTQIISDQDSTQVRGQYVDPNGLPVWGVGGIALSQPGRFDRNPVPAAYPDRGMFFWFDRLEGISSLPRQVVSTGGALFLTEGGVPLTASLAGRADLAGCVDLGDRFCSFWVDERRNMQIYYQISDAAQQPFLEENGRPLNPPGAGFEILTQVEKTPWNTAAILYRYVSDDYSQQLCYLQEIEPSGNCVYPGAGVFLGNNFDFNYGDSMGFSGGDIYLGWTSWDNEIYQICGQRIANGLKQWGETGKVIAVMPANCFASLESVKGAYYLWRVEDYDQNTTQCRVLRVTPGGIPAPGWSDSGINILEAAGYYNQEVQLAGLQGQDLIVFIRLSEYGNYPTRAQRISASGQRLWQDTGVDLVPDGTPAWVQDADFGVETGFVYSTQDTQNDNLLFQRIDANGQLLLAPAVVISEGLNNCYDANLVRFADGSWLCAWSDNDGAWIQNRDVLIRHISPQGMPLGNTPEVFCGARYQQASVKAATIGNLAFLAWSDDRAGILDSETAITGIWGKSYTSHFAPVADPELSASPQPALHANFPNPFNPCTTVSFSLPHSGNVILAIYNLKGQLVKTLIPDSALDTGDHSRIWDGSDEAGRPVASGVYLCRLVFEDAALTRKMLLAK